jgi:hypothetical protein
MRPPIFVRSLTEAERERLEAGLRSADVYELRRCQILLASDRGEWVPRIATTRPSATSSASSSGPDSTPA